jgi:membrane-bound lytic murein transglycosylase F
MVAAGEADLTVADEHLLDIELVQGLAVRSAFTLGEARPHAVAVRSSNPELLAAVNAFIAEKRNGYLYNVLYQKYFKDKRSVRRLAAGRVEGDGESGLSPWDDLVRKYAERYGFDWRLITAQMYAESRFDPDAKSFAGALGLMQLMPRTAEGLGITEIEKPENGIHAGVKYLDWLRERFEDRLPISERLWFTLAAYNAGYGHIADARRLAREKCWDPDRWFGNTENAILLLSRKDYAKKARYGYVRGSQVVEYVRDIRERFQAYIDVTDAALAGLPDAARLGQILARVYNRPIHLSGSPEYGWTQQMGQYTAPQERAGREARQAVHQTDP